MTVKLKKIVSAEGTKGMTQLEISRHAFYRQGEIDETKFYVDVARTEVDIFSFLYLD